MVSTETRKYLGREVHYVNNQGYWFCHWYVHGQLFRGEGNSRSEAFQKMSRVKHERSISIY